MKPSSEEEEKKSVSERKDTFTLLVTQNKLFRLLSLASFWFFTLDRWDFFHALRSTVDFENVKTPVSLSLHVCKAVQDRGRKKIRWSVWSNQHSTVALYVILLYSVWYIDNSLVFFNFLLFLCLLTRHLAGDRINLRSVNSAKLSQWVRPWAKSSIGNTFFLLFFFLPGTFSPSSSSCLCCSSSPLLLPSLSCRSPLVIV